MLFFIIQGKGKVDSIDAQLFVEQATEGDAAAGTNVKRFLVVQFQMHIARGLVTGMINRHQVGIGTAGGGRNGHFDPWRRMGMDMRGEQLDDLCWLLIRHQAAGNLGMRGTG